MVGHPCLLVWDNSQFFNSIEAALCSNEGWNSSVSLHTATPDTSVINRHVAREFRAEFLPSFLEAYSSMETIARDKNSGINQHLFCEKWRLASGLQANMHSSSSPLPSPVCWVCGVHDFSVLTDSRANSNPVGPGVVVWRHYTKHPLSHWQQNQSCQFPR